MAIYLGDQGHIELARKGGGEALYSNLVPSDVNVTQHRFSVNFVSGALLTGDSVTVSRIQVKGAAKKNLQLVKDHDYPDWAGYIHVDALGGIRLYTNFADALLGYKIDAIELVTPTEKQEIKIESRDINAKCLAQVSGYEISTTRETIDTTTLSNQFRNYLKNGLISGQGQLQCFWEHRVNRCERTGQATEFTAYLAHLCIRLQQGAGFLGKFFLYDGNADEPSVWYEAECIVTNVSISVSPDQLIESAVDFITTGPVVLKRAIEPLLLVQEDTSLILQENGLDAIVAAINDT
jgi:hypothetical protein